MVVHPGETLVVDFGQNCAVGPCFGVHGKEVPKLNCRPSEILNDGMVRRAEEWMGLKVVAIA